MRNVVPFTPIIRSGKNESQQVAEQLNALIKQQEGQGWRFCHLENISTIRTNGCLAGLFGNSATVLTFQVAVFERP